MHVHETNVGDSRPGLVHSRMSTVRSLRQVMPSASRKMKAPTLLYSYGGVVGTSCGTHRILPHLTRATKAHRSTSGHHPHVGGHDIASHLRNPALSPVGAKVERYHNLTSCRARFV